MNKFILLPEDVPLAPLAGNRELMHKMTIPFHDRFVPIIFERNDH